MKKNRKLLLIALFMLALVSLGVSYAYWASISLEDTIEGNTVTVGTGVTSTVSATSEDATEGSLVPVGQAENSVEEDAVEFIIFTFEVEWTLDAGEAFRTGTLDLSFENVLLEGLDEEDYAHLVNLTYQVGGTANLVTGVLNGDGDDAIEEDGAVVTVYVKVTLTEPFDDEGPTPGFGNDDAEDEITPEQAQAIANAIFGQTISFDVVFTVTED